MITFLISRFDPSILNLKAIVSEVEERKQSMETNLAETSLLEHPDSKIFWRLNFDRFHLEMR